MHSFQGVTPKRLIMALIFGSKSNLLYHVNPATRQTIDQSAGDKLRDKNAKESWALLEDLALYDNKIWNDPRDFAKPVKATSLPQDVLSTSDRHLINVKNQVQRLIEAHLALKSSVQVNKITSSCTIFEVLPYPFNYPTRRLTIKEMLAKFIDKGKREHEEMEIFIIEFRTTNELFLKTRGNLLSELKIKVNELSKVVSNVLIPKNEVKRVTTRRGKMTSEATRSKEINETGINKNKPHRFEQDVQEKSHDDGVENKSSSIPKRTTQPSIKPQQSSILFPNRSLLTNKSRLEEACTKTMNERCSAVLLNKPPLKEKEKDPRSLNILCQVLEKHKEAKDLAAEHLSRFENPHMEVLTEKEIADKFPDDHLMVLKSKFNNDEPWCADFVKTYFWEEPYAFKLSADNIMRRCVAGSETLEILAHCHSGSTGGHHSVNVTTKKVYESGFYWFSVFKDANEYVCEVFDVWGLDFMGPFTESRGNKYILVVVDYVSKWVEGQALPTNDARVVVKFLRQLFARFGVPKALISDRGVHFCNSQLEKALQRYDVTQKLSTTYHPQSNGQTEVTNRAIKRILERSVGYNPKDGRKNLTMHYEHLGQPTKHRQDLTLASESRLMQLNKLAELRDGAYENTRIYKERTKKWHDSRLRGDKDFKVSIWRIMGNGYGVSTSCIVLVLSARSYPIEDPQSSSHPLNLINAIKTCSKQTNDFQKDHSKVKTLTVNEIKTPKLKELEQSLEDEFKDLHLNLPVLKVLAHVLMYNAILDKYVESLELDNNGFAFIQGEMPEKMKHPGLFTLPCRLGDFKPFDTLADLGSYVNLIPLYLFKKLKIGLLEETDHVFGLVDGTKSYPVGIVKNIEVHIGWLKLLEDFYFIYMEKGPTTPLLVGRGFLATGNAVIDCRKAKIAVGEGITRSVFGVKEINVGDEVIPYWTTLDKSESYEPRPSTDNVGARPPFYVKKDFMEPHFPWE
ncbi:reverse transcriptase domain-containing protein [Tanacetum coccineum]